MSRSVRPERAKALLQIRAVALTGRSLCLQFPMAMPWAISSLPLRGANALLRPLLHPFTVYLTIYSPPFTGSPMLITSEYVSGGKGVGLLGLF